MPSAFEIACSVQPRMRREIAELQDCDADFRGSWEPTETSRSWEESGGWPLDAMWTESTWSNGIPSMVVFQVIFHAMQILSF